MMMVSGLVHLLLFIFLVHLSVMFYRMSIRQKNNEERISPSCVCLSSSHLPCSYGTYDLYFFVTYKYKKPSTENKIEKSLFFFHVLHFRFYFHLSMFFNVIIIWRTTTRMEDNILQCNSFLSLLYFFILLFHLRFLFFK